MRRAILSLVVLCTVVFAWGCQEVSPEERVAKARARYSVTLNGFFAKEPAPPVIEVPEEEAEEVAMAVTAEGEEVGEGQEEMEEEAAAGPPTVDILLDLIVQHDMDEALPGVTVDLVMVDPERNEKGAWKIWIETAGLPKANQKQVTHVLEDVAYEEGDGFTVELVAGIPADLGAYREFAGAATQ